MFSFFKRKKKTSEISEKPVEPALETRQPETLEEGVALTPVPEHSISGEFPVEEGDAPREPDAPTPEPVIPKEPPVKEPPAKEPPTEEPPAPAEPPPQEPPSREPPVKEPPATSADTGTPTPAAPSAPVQAEAAQGRGDSARQIQQLPKAPPIHVDLTDKAASAKKSADQILARTDDRGGNAGPASTAADKSATAAGVNSVPVETPAPEAPVAASNPTPATSAPAPTPASAVAPDTSSASATVSATPDKAPIAATAAPAAPAPATTAERPKSEKRSWLTRLKDGLSRTGTNISSLFVGVKVDENLFEELETALIMADAGVEATESLLGKLRAKVKKERIEDAQTVKRALRDLLTEHLQPLEKPFSATTDKTRVVMIAGVNGAGKTTSIGKLAHHFQAQGHNVLLAAGDTFRAAAREQLIEWGSRNNVAVIAQDGGDPAAVAFDAVNAGRARKASIVMVDTAGRLPTQLHLMEELKKIKRVIGKADGEAPHEVLLVVDGNTGQNAISQIKAFDAALTLTGLVVTKLDGTAKGGTLAAVAAGGQGVRPVPVYWIGVGESLQDLQPFVAAEFAGALLGD